MCHTFYYRTNWIKIHGKELHKSAFVHSGWQEDDLPFFGKISDIIIIAGSSLLYVEKYNTQGINAHVSAYLISRSHCSQLLLCTHSFCLVYAHTYIGDGQLYIALCSYIEICK